MKFKVGELVKITTVENRVFRVKGFSRGQKVIPDGWLIDQNGFSINPKFCEKYEGATSCFAHL